MVDTLPQQGVLRVIPPGALDRIEANKAKEAAAAQDAPQPATVLVLRLQLLDPKRTAQPARFLRLAQEPNC